MKKKCRVFPAIVDGKRTRISKIPKDISDEELIRLWQAGRLVIREKDTPKTTTD